MPFITAKEGPPNVGSTIYTVQYFDENGNMVIRSDGSKGLSNIFSVKSEISFS